MVKKFADRIHFIHLRTTKRETEHDTLVFHEAAHLNGDVDMYEVISEILKEENTRRKNGNADAEIPMRPDHGHQMLNDLNSSTYPGYSAIGRLKGLAEIRGMEMAIKRNMGN